MAKTLDALMCARDEGQGRSRAGVPGVELLGMDLDLAGQLLEEGGGGG